MSRSLCSGEVRTPAPLAQRSFKYCADASFHSEFSKLSAVWACQASTSAVLPRRSIHAAPTPSNGFVAMSQQPSSHHNMPARYSTGYCQHSLGRLPPNHAPEDVTREPARRCVPCRVPELIVCQADERFVGDARCQRSGAICTVVQS